MKTIIYEIDYIQNGKTYTQNFASATALSERVASLISDELSFDISFRGHKMVSSSDLSVETLKNKSINEIRNTVVYRISRHMYDQLGLFRNEI